MKTAVMKFTVLTMASIGIGFVEPASAQQDPIRAISEKLVEISKACEEQGQILAEARIRKFEKAGQNVQERLGENAYAVISRVMQQQCVSIWHVALLRTLKSVVSTDDARRMNIDAEISRQMDIIERTL